MTERADDWKSYIALDGTHVIVVANAPTTVAELLERRGVHRAQIVQNAEGTESHLIAELIDEAWRLADFAARHELVPQLAELQAKLSGTDCHGRPLGGDRERDGRLLAAAQGVDLTAGAVDNTTRAHWYESADVARAKLADWAEHPSDCLWRRGHTCPDGGAQ